MSAAPTDYTALKESFAQQPFFAGKSWQLSPKAYFLDEAQRELLKKIGAACAAFYQAIEFLYRKTSADKSILRNKDFKASWVADYLDKGKPDWLKKHSLHKAIKGSIPAIIRPDLLVTKHGFRLTELDSVPGGFPLTAYLTGQYAGGCERMDEVFLRFWKALAKEGPETIFIACSEEAADYRPELIYCAQRLQALGKAVYCVPTKALERAENGGIGAVIEGVWHQADVLYRFFELFDWENIPLAQEIAEAAEKGFLHVTPPMKPYQEEKLNLALFHHFQLEAFWQQALSEEHYNILKSIIPMSWIVDPTPIPPNGRLWGPKDSWAILMDAIQTERRYILKCSGFNQMAWGSRSVTCGPDVPKEVWRKKLLTALESFEQSPYVLQTFEQTALKEHPVYNTDGTVSCQPWRVRLCPYYATIEGHTEHLSTLATLCPADKKIIHGMSDALMLPAF